MPKKPTESLVGYRIEVNEKERELLQHFATSYRIQALTGSDGLFDELADFDKVLKVLGAIGGLLELFGIIDIFDFDDDIKASVMEAVGKIKAKVEEDKGEGKTTVETAAEVFIDIAQAASLVPPNRVEPEGANRASERWRGFFKGGWRP